MQGKLPWSLLRPLVRAESLMFMAIAVALVVIAVVVFVRGVHDLVLAPHGEQFAVTITRAVNSALFIVVILELVRTIMARLEGGGFQLQPFLVIGIISATRDILTVGVELSLTGADAAGPHDDRTGSSSRTTCSRHSEPPCSGCWQRCRA